jgi:hypothetical protein
MKSNAAALPPQTMRDLPDLDLLDLLLMSGRMLRSDVRDLERYRAHRLRKNPGRYQQKSLGAKTARVERQRAHLALVIAEAQRRGLIPHGQGAHSDELPPPAAADAAAGGPVTTVDGRWEPDRNHPSGGGPGSSPGLSIPSSPETLPC